MAASWPLPGKSACGRLTIADLPSLSGSPAPGRGSGAGALALLGLVRVGPLGAIAIDRLTEPTHNLAVEWAVLLVSDPPDLVVQLLGQAYGRRHSLLHG